MLSTKFRQFSASIVNITYDELIGGSSLVSKIDEAYGAGGLGVLTVSDIPGYAQKREALLPLASKLAALDPEVLKSLEVPKVHYGIGWSLGKEQFNGIPDFSKGSYYANPEYDTPSKESEGVYHPNVWPREHLAELEGAFKTCGREVCKVGYLLCKRIDRFIEYNCRDYPEGLFTHLLQTGKNHLARLLHYYPQEGDNQNWCGWHNDHGALTGLTSALFMNEETGEIIDASEIDDPETGLFFRTRNKEIIKGKIPTNSLAFQIGETAQILSCGTLQATPHAVRTSGKHKQIARNTFAVFMEPGPDGELNAYDDNIENIFVEHDDVPSLRDRWTPGMTFEEFNKKTMESFVY